MAKRKPSSGVVDPSIALKGGDVKKRRATYKIVKSCLKEFGHYTLENRAVCRVFDGLNPSQRRLLWVLYTLKRHSKSVPSKCARIIGETIGKYHPHGDQSAYETLVKLSHKRYPLVQQHGNFGNNDGLEPDPAAAMRYTETRLSEFGDRFFDDIAVIPLIKSFTDEDEEPEVLPARVPIALVNGSMGIALGLSPHIPPHNLREVINACKHLVENPEASSLELTKFLRGPDYGLNTGFITSSRKTLQALYIAGEGKVNYACSYHIEEGKSTSKLVITGKSPGFSAKKLVNTTKALQDKKLLVAAANDEGSLEIPVRITVEFKDYHIIRDRVLPLLKTSQSYRFYSLDTDNKPRKYDLKRMLDDFLDFRRAIETAVLKREKAALERKLGIEQAKRAAIMNIDFVVEVMKTSKKVEAAVSKLCKGLKLKEWQAEVILNSQIRSLMNLNKKAIEDRIKDLKTNLKRVIADLKNIDGVIVRRLDEMLKYADPRGMPIGKEKDLNGVPDDTKGPGFKWLAMTSKGKVDRFEQVPIKSRAAWNYASFVPAGDPVLVVADNNTAVIEAVSYLDKFNLKDGNVVGVVPCSVYSTAVVVTSDGRYCAIDLSNSKRKRPFKLFRDLGKATIKDVVGLGPRDSFIVMYEEGDLDEYKVKDLRVGRPNVKPKPLNKEFVGCEVLTVLTKRKGDFLCTSEGEELGTGDMVDPKMELYSVGKINIAILDTGKRLLVPQADVLDLLEDTRREVATIINLPAKRIRRKKK